MEVGIIGPQGAGKSTLFHSLTGVRPGLSGKVEITRGIAQVHDPRIDHLKEIYSSKKKIYTAVTYLDSPPVETGGFRKASFRQEFLRGMVSTDAMLVTVPCFMPGQIDEAAGIVNDLQTEFILSDLEILEKRLIKIRHDLKRGLKEFKAEVELLERCQTGLENEIPLRKLEFKPDEVITLRSFSFLTNKPKMIVLNIAEDDIGSRLELEKRVAGELPEYRIISICAKIQSEIADLSEEEIPVFMEELGIAESASDKVIRRTREMLGLITFLTGGDDEARAWNLKKGGTALEAAGVIHSDIQRGFIRAEIFHYDQIVEHGSENALKAKGLIRSEGKDYIVKDGDVVYFRFNV